MSRSRPAVAFAAALGLVGLCEPMAFAGDRPANLPPNAHPGECYGKVVMPPVYGVSKRQVQIAAGWTETVHTADVVERVGRKVLVRSAQVERTEIAPVWRKQVTWVTRPGARRLVTEPARYETVREKVLIEAGHAEWRRSDAPLAYGESSSGQTLLQATGEVMCRVWVPARYSTSSRRVLVASGRSYTVEGPSRKEQVVRTVQVSPGGWRERRIPAVYRTEYVTRVVRRGSTRIIRHPAAYRTIESSQLVKPQREGWLRILCGGTINPAFMAKVQEALIARGFDPGQPDGVAHAQTYTALHAFQRQQRLPQGQLTEETARALGVM